MTQCKNCGLEFEKTPTVGWATPYGDFCCRQCVNQFFGDGEKKNSIRTEERVITLLRGFQIRFDGPPSHKSPRFVEVENLRGESISIGEWIEDENNEWVLRVNSCLTDTELT